jgi:hypothetical protein
MLTAFRYYSNTTLWPRLSQLVYATDEISKGLYAEVIPLGSIGKFQFHRLAPYYMVSDSNT